MKLALANVRFVLLSSIEQKLYPELGKTSSTCSTEQKFATRSGSKYFVPELKILIFFEMYQATQFCVEPWQNHKSQTRHF